MNIKPLSLKKVFLDGCASMLDLFGLYEPSSVREIIEQDDASAIMSDWEAVGGDLWAALDKV